ncbi:class I adenylate-forming enzyme family protein [Nocardia carnea]|uniref:class I adenylate-forming enzyme family protein n=1 Tax=Nocardia carnea TaxID=37328 RepID=UPI002453A724|nr:class I adenylate-forming enzyme family protein [Nocardia carnea]
MTGLRQALGKLWHAPDDAQMVRQDDRWWSWGEVRTLAENIDAELRKAGAVEGARVGVVLGNRMESVAALLALLGNGRTVVTLNPMQPMGRVAADLAGARPRVVLAPESYWREEEFADVTTQLGIAGFVLGADGIRRRSDEPPTADGGADELAGSVAVEMFTSGTTGTPKRVPLTWRQLDAALSAVHGHTGAARPDREPLTGRVGIVTLAIVHIGGMWAVLQALAEARPFVLLPRFTVERWVSAIEEHQPRIASLPPAAMRSVLNAEVPAERLASLRAVSAGTTFVSPDLAEEFTTRYGIPVLIMYGATEFSGAIAGWTKPMHAQWWRAKRGSVGRPFPGVEVRAVDDDGEPAAAGTTGRLEVRSGQTGGAGWLRTNDLAHIDSDGFLYIDGRADDAIIRGGFKIQPEVVADALRSHESVLDATVYGRPDERLGQVPVAVVELVETAGSIDEEELKAFTRDRLTAYEVPVTIHVVDELPRSASLKVDRRRLLEMVSAREEATA